MKIRFLASVTSARGVFAKGDVVDWKEEDAWPLVASGSAEIAAEEAPRPRKAGR